MFKFQKKNLFLVIVFCCLLIFLSAIIPALRAPFLNTLKFPVTLLTFLRYEIGGIIFYHRNLTQNERLRRENDILRYKLNAANEVLLENKRLRELLSLKQNSAYKVIPAKVIAHSLDNWSSLILVDKGDSSGIKKGFAVINYLGLVGRVVEVTSLTSKIMLISDPNLGVSAMVQRSRQEGLACGTLGGTLIMKYLAGDADIKVSDMVITSGLTGIYPKGLLIGTVININDEFSGLSRSAVIKPAVDLSGLEEVLIIVD